MSTNINDPWDRDDDPLGSIESTQLALRENDHKPIFFIGESNPYYKEIIKMMDDNNASTVVVIKGAAVGWTEKLINVGTPGHCNYEKFENRMLNIVSEIYDDIPANLFKLEPNVINVDNNNEFVELCRSVQADARRYMMVAPDRIPDNIPVLKKSNNKPWYQDRKHYRNKKSRRKL